MKRFAVAFVLAISLTLGAVGVYASAPSIGSESDIGLFNEVTTINGYFLGTRKVITKLGHFASPADSANVPTVGTCGTSPSLSSTATDTAGTITTGSTSTTSCTVTFASAFSAAPVCLFTDANNSITPVAYSAGAATTTSVVVKYAAGTSQVINYHCFGK